MEVEIRIRPAKGFGGVNVREMWNHRELLSMLVWRDLAIRYKQTLLGPIWFLIQPLLPTLVFTVVFGKVARVSTDGAPGFLFFLCNQIAWNYVAASFASASACLQANLHLFGKVYFPRLVVPLASIASNSAAVAIQLAFFFLAWWWYRERSAEGANLRMSWFALLTPLVFLLAAAQALAFGLWMAALTGKYRDLQHLVPVIIQLWMYASGVVFPLSQVPVRYRHLAALNPVMFVTESLRRCLLGAGTVSWSFGAYAVGVTLVVLGSGILVFQRAARDFVDIA
jgi:lipopolysaccharide transport system permease protein